MRITKISIVILLSCLTQAYAADIQISATVDRSTVALNQTFKYTIELSGDKLSSIKANPIFPDIEEFAVFMGSSGTTQNVQIVNGKMNVSKSISGSYMAGKAGKYTIPPAELEFNGTVYKSNTIDLEILSQAAQPRTTQPNSRSSQSSAQGSLEDNIFLRVFVNKKKAYVNEPVIITYKIYTAVTITSYAMSKAPETEGFWVEDFPMGDQPKTRREMYKGREFLVAEIKKMALFPTDAGIKKIGPMQIDCDVRVQSRRRSMFDSFFDDPFFGRSVRHSVAAPSVQIDVQPLPVVGKPADFSGAVGQYALRSSVDKTSVETNNAIALKVVLSGTGNIKMLPEPRIDIPPDFERYDPKVSQQINRSGSSITGSKTYEYVLIPRFPGIQKIKPVSFNYFDTESKTYKRLLTKEIVIDVAKGDEDMMVVGSGLSKEEVKLLGSDIHFIQTAVPAFSKRGRYVYNSPLFLMLLVLPLAILGATVYYRSYQDKLSENVAYARNRKANSLAMRRLKKARRVLSESTQKAFYAETSKALLGFLADKFNISAAGIVTDQVEELMKKNGIEETVISQYMECLQTCDYQRFAPSTSSMEQMNAFYEKAKSAIIAVEKII
ncbi:MAG: BatD family protein [candidate division KSB1 bacterium]|jgi:hypothetical protein|nr:BatD family protein [candidate division KSB1 bacterium]